MRIEYEVPIETRTTLNSRLHWAVKDKKVAAERRAVAYRTPSEVKTIGPLITVTLTRVSPRQLDSDNLQGALKAVRDQVASSLGVDDRSSIVEWVYAQERGEAKVRIAVEVVKP